MDNTQNKVVQKLLKRARSFGFNDASFSIFDCCDSMHAIDEDIEAGNELAELVGAESFCDFIYSNPEAMEQYIQGYASAVEDVEDLPEDLNDGRASSLTMALDVEQQTKVRELVIAAA